MDETGRVTVQEKRRIKAVFMERMELDQFPFDTQVQKGFSILISIYDFTTLNVVVIK